MSTPRSSLLLLPTFKAFLAATASHLRQKTPLSPTYSRSPTGITSRPSTPAAAPLTYNFVIGNQAGDTDSCISSLTLAYQLALESNAPYTSDAALGLVPTPLFAPDRFLHIPVLPFPRADLSLRADTLLLLSWADVDPASDLLFIDDEAVAGLFAGCLRDGDKQSAAPNVSLTLVDHATFNPSRSFLASLSSSSSLPPAEVSARLSALVAYIVDHHPTNPVDLTSHPHLQPSSSSPPATTIAIPPRPSPGAPAVAFSPRVVVDPLASCATLVAERSLSFLAYLAAEHSLLLDATPALLLLHGCVSLDCGDSASGKKTRRDAELLESLEAALSSAEHPNTTPTLQSHLSPASLSSAAKRLMDRRTDPSFWLSLSPADAARLDYKRFECGAGGVAVGMSSICVSVSAFLDAARREAGSGGRGLKEFLDGEDVAALVVMGHGKGGREMLIIDGGKGGGTAAELGRLLAEKEGEGKEGGTLLLNDMEAGDSLDGYSRAFTQGNKKGSRKQVAPIIVDLVKGMSVSD